MTRVSFLDSFRLAFAKYALTDSGSSRFVLLLMDFRELIADSIVDSR